MTLSPAEFHPLTSDLHAIGDVVTHEAALHLVIQQGGFRPLQPVRAQVSTEVPVFVLVSGAATASIVDTLLTGLDPLLAVSTAEAERRRVAEWDTFFVPIGNKLAVPVPLPYATADDMTKAGEWYPKLSRLN